MEAAPVKQWKKSDVSNIYVIVTIRVNVFWKIDMHTYSLVT